MLALRARGLAALDDCEQALPLLERARESLSQDAELARLEGECQIRLKQYQAAVESLRDAKRLSPTLEDVDLYLAIAFYHLEYYVISAKRLEASVPFVSHFSEAQYHLYSGLLSLRRAETRAAALSLERARLVDAPQVEPVASYYAGLAWQSINERALARESLERVIEMDRGGTWARNAELALSAQGTQDRGWVNLTVGLEYDSNVGLFADGVPLGDSFSSEDDGRGVVFLEGGIGLFLTERASGGILASYSGSANFELDEFDVHYPTLSLWLDIDLDTRTIVRSVFEVGYAWVGSDPFVTTQDATLALHRNFGSFGNTELLLGWSWNDYHFELPFVPINTTQPRAPGTPCVLAPGEPDLMVPCSPFDVDPQDARRRDGNGLRLGLNHLYSFDSENWAWVTGLVLRGSYAFARYWAVGSDYDAASHRFEIGLGSRWPRDVAVDLTMSFVYIPYDHPSSYPAPFPESPDPPPANEFALPSSNRLDQIFFLSATAELPVHPEVSLAIKYEFVHSDSNVAIFSYQRSILGSYIIGRF